MVLLLLLQAAHLNVRVAVYEVHSITAHISSKVKEVVCKLRAQLICAHYLAQLVLCRPVQDEASAGDVVMLKQEDDSLLHT